MKPTPFALALLAGGASLTLGARTSQAGSKTGVSVESTNLYSPCGLSPDLTNSNSSADAFLAGVVFSGSPFVRENFWQDSNAWNVDFLDPFTSDAPAGADDDDTTDTATTAISFFQGHGIGSIGGTSGCTAASQCTSPPAGLTNGWGGGPLTSAGTCALNPITEDKFSGDGECGWPSFRALVTCGSGDNGTTSTLQHFAVLSGPNMVLGNNPVSGDWRGAGTQGGASLAIFHISHGLDAWYPNKEWSSLYGGIRIFASIFVGPGGDTADSPGFGSAVAKAFQANQNGTVGSAYTNAISSVQDGSGCEENGTPDKGLSFGGGINGCGCNAAISYSNTATNAHTLLDTTWVGLESSSALADSTAAYYYDIGCNYNPQTYGWLGGN